MSEPTIVPAGRRVRVLHAITRLDFGGSARETIETVRGLPADRFEVLLAYGGATEPPPGVASVRIRALVRDPSPWRDALALVSLVRAIRRFRPDIVHTHTSKAGVLGRIAARIAGVKRIVHTPHGHILYGYPEIGRLRRRVFLFLERFLARRTDRLVGLTPAEPRESAGAGIGRSGQWVLIPSGIELADYRSVRPDPDAKRRLFGIDPSDFVVGCVGRLDPVKGQRTLVLAWPAVVAKCPRARLVLVGDGSERAALEALAVTLGVRGSIVFAGVRGDVPACLSAFDLFAIPSENEGMGRSLVEALSAGVPALGSRVGGIPDVLPDGAAGLLLAAGDPAAWAAAIAGLAADPGARARMSENARAAAGDAYDRATSNRRIAALYEELLAPKR